MTTNPFPLCPHRQSLGGSSHVVLERTSPVKCDRRAALRPSSGGGPIAPKSIPVVLMFGIRALEPPEMHLPRAIGMDQQYKKYPRPTTLAGGRGQTVGPVMRSHTQVWPGSSEAAPLSRFGPIPIWRHGSISVSGYSRRYLTQPKDDLLVSDSATNKIRTGSS